MKILLAGNKIKKLIQQELDNNNELIQAESTIYYSNYNYYKLESLKESLKREAKIEDKKRKVDEIKTLFTDKYITLRRVITEDENKDEYIVYITNPNGSIEEYIFLVVTSNIISAIEGVYRPLKVDWTQKGNFLEPSKDEKML